jgi:hypothetical protein
LTQKLAWGSSKKWLVGVEILKVGGCNEKYKMVFGQNKERGSQSSPLTLRMVFMWYILLSKTSWRNEEVKERELNGMPSKGV